MPMASTEILPGSSSFLLQQDSTSTDLTYLSPCYADLWSSLLNEVGPALGNKGPGPASSDAVARAPNSQFTVVTKSGPAMWDIKLPRCICL